MAKKPKLGSGKRFKSLSRKLPVMAPASGSPRWTSRVLLGCWARRDSAPPFEADDSVYPWSRACGDPRTDQLGLCRPHRARYDSEVFAVAGEL